MSKERSRGMPRQGKPVAIKRKSKATSQGSKDFNRKRKQNPQFNFYLGDDGTVYYEDRHER